MNNPIFSIFGNAPQNNISNLKAQIEQFKNNFTGDPRQKVQELLNSGQMTQEQFNRLSQEANQIMGIFR